METQTIIALTLVLCLILIVLIYELGLQTGQRQVCQLQTTPLDFI